MKINNLSNIQNVMNNAVNNNFVSGCNCLIFQNNKQIGYYEAGFLDVEKKVPFSRDTICRLFSMTKPVTAVATMILVEKGIIDLCQNVADFIPEFNNLKVWKNNQIEKCNRPILIKDLLNMTSGYSYGSEANPAEKELGSFIYEFLNKNVVEKNDFSTMDFAKKVAEIPLSFEPGTDYQYGISADILAAVIEVDTPMYSKIERGECKAKREHVKLIAQKLNVDEKELLTIWLADKVLDVVDEEQEIKKDAIIYAHNEIKTTI